MRHLLGLLIRELRMELEWNRRCVYHISFTDRNSTGNGDQDTTKGRNVAKLTSNEYFFIGSHFSSLVQMRL